MSCFKNEKLNYIRQSLLQNKTTAEKYTFNTYDWDNVSYQTLDI